MPYSEQYTRCTIESVTDDLESRPQRVCSFPRVLTNARRVERLTRWPAIPQTLTVSGDKFDGIRTLVLEDDWIELPAVVGE